EKSAGAGLLVKVLPGALSLAVDSSRFEQEIARLGRRLRHPSLVAPRTAGRVGSFVYHTRTFVEGTTLRAWLARHGELPLRRAVEPSARWADAGSALASGSVPSGGG